MRVGTAVAIGLLVCGCAVSRRAFVDVGACPGEGCQYGERWVAREAVRLRSAPNSSASSTGMVQAGEAVQTLTGEVHTIPGRFVVRRPHGEFVPGDEVLVYTYLGEGVFRVRHNGTLKDADLEFSPWGGSGGDRCQDESRCWGILKQQLQSEWWVRVRTGTGTDGWVLDASKFLTPGNH